MALRGESAELPKRYEKDMRMVAIKSSANLPGEIMQTIQEIMEQWARWRYSRKSIYGACMTGRLLDGIKKIKCSACTKGEVLIKKQGQQFWMPCSSCLGTQWVVPKFKTAHHSRNCQFCRDDQGVSRGEINGITCHACRGSGKIPAQSEATKVNPKLIRSTGVPYPDELSPRVDRLVCQLSRMGKRVVLQEYDWNGTPTIKCARLRITHDNYRKILQRQHELILIGLEEKILTLSQN